ncbi:hypothetical protein C9374_003431 [Naegleria lovaniensis]|uniref:Cytochrome P450 n=1 Tax=Naegleria lovaniensis TaxID=51637 RepID=A0AA88KLR8_NAELO|nr:uncharacterized protein C9374_003431 [Naegleria lovaniensis]KAG2385616.1 hypothetical protein C9374_003431 [Naegleria lovaniensis]
MFHSTALFIYTIMGALIITSALFLLWSYRRYRSVCKKYSIIPYGREQFIPPILCSYLPEFLIPKDWGKRLGENLAPKTFAKFMRESGYDKVYKVVLGIFNQGIVVIGDSDFLKDVATKKLTVKGNELNSTVQELFGGSNVFTETEYEVWHRHRKILEPSFSPSSLALVAEVTTNVVLNELIPRITENGYRREVDKDFSSLTLDVIGRAGFNYSFNSFASHDNSSLTAQTQTLFHMLPLYELFPKFIRDHIGIFPHKPAKDIASRFTDAIQKIIQNRTAHSEMEYHDILSILLQARDEGKKNNESDSMTDEELISNCFVLLIAGHETTAKTLGFALYLLASSKDAQERLHKFIDQDYPALYGKDTFDFADYQAGRLDYVKAIVKETLRLFPPVIAAMRELTKPYTYKGYHLPKGFRVAASWQLMHRDEKYWPEPDEFIPERFLKKKKEDKLQEEKHQDDKPELVTPQEFISTPKMEVTCFNPHIAVHNNPFAYAPFGIGNRICIGRNFAEVEAVIALALLAKHFKFSISENYKMELDMFLTLRPRDTLYINFEKKQK